jgi:hypothetical protein
LKFSRGLFSPLVDFLVRQESLRNLTLEEAYYGRQSSPRVRTKLRRRFNPPKEGLIDASQKSRGPVTDEAKEFAKQLVLYADAITAFAVVQLIAFVYLLVHGDCFTANVLHNVCYPIAGSVIVTVIYVLLVRWCHYGENCILNSSRDSSITSLKKWTWRFRYAVIILACAATVGILDWVDTDKGHVFRIDCKGESSATH